MNIIILSKNYGNYTSGYYHQDIINAFKRKANCHIYGEGYPNYNRNDTIDDVISKLKIKIDEIDLIIVSTSWEIQDPTILESDPHPKIDLSCLNTPKLFFLNKEYKKLQKKLEYAEKNEFDLVATVHHDYKGWVDKTGLKFIQLPFGVDPNRFKDYGFPRKYDFGFTGALHKTYTDIRYQIKNLLFIDTEIKSNVRRSVLFKGNPLNNKFRKYKIYWAEWGARDIFGRSLLPSGSKYIKFLNSFKTFLSTPSAIGIIGTRYFECMATKTLLICPESEYYRDIFIDGYNCIMFKEDLSNFEKQLEYILTDEQERARIVENAYIDFMNNHTYDKRIERLLGILCND